MKTIRCNEILKERNPIISFSNIAIRAELVPTTKLSKEFELWSDWVVAIYSAIKGDFFYIPEKLLKWRIHKQSANKKYMQDLNPKILGMKFKNWIFSDIGEPVLNQNLIGRAFNLIGFALYYHFSVFALLIEYFLKKKKIV